MNLDLIRKALSFYHQKGGAIWDPGYYAVPPGPLAMELGGSDDGIELDLIDNDIVFIYYHGDQEGESIPSHRVIEALEKVGIIPQKEKEDD